MSRETPSSGDEPWTFTKGPKRIGTNQGAATSQLGYTHTHAKHAGGRFGTSVTRLGGLVCQGKLSLPAFCGRYMSGGGGGGGGELRLARRNCWALPRALNWELSQRARRLQ